MARVDQDRAQQMTSMSTYLHFVSVAGLERANSILTTRQDRSNKRGTESLDAKLSSHSSLLLQVASAEIC
jgi:hypothetical protein